MSPSISCFYVHYNRFPCNFTFIKFEKFVKVILNSKAVVMTNKQLVENVKLFKIFKLSLLLTEDTTQISSTVHNTNGKKMYGVWTKWYWKSLRLTNDYELTLMEKSMYSNPLNASEPKRISSNKKFNKFLKLLDNIDASGRIKEPEVIVSQYFEYESAEVYDYFRRYIEYNRKIEMLSVVLHNYGRDVYSAVRRFT
jgi:hypothetical protein